MKHAAQEGGYVDPCKVDKILTIPEQPVGNWNLTNSNIAALAQYISTTSLEDIAVKYLNMDFEEIRNLKWKNKDNQSFFKHSLLHQWLQGNSGPDSAYVSILLI